MKAELKNTNIVVLAEDYNPSIVSQDWLISHEIIKKDEKIINFVHTSAFSVLETEIFHFVVDPKRLQVSIKKISRENMTYLQHIISTYIKCLPETPYKALGINYLYILSVSLEKLKELCAGKDDLFKKVFGKDYKIGGLIDFKYDEFKVKLQLKQVEKNVFGDFNFHLESSDKNKIIDNIQKFPNIMNDSEKILGGIL